MAVTRHCVKVTGGYERRGLKAFKLVAIVSPQNSFDSIIKLVLHNNKMAVVCTSMHGFVTRMNLLLFSD